MTEQQPASQKSPKTRPPQLPAGALRADVSPHIGGLVPKVIQVGTVIEQNLELLRKPGIMAARPGYHIENGWPVGDPVIVVTVASRKGDAADYGIPSRIKGIPVEIREASALEQMRATRPSVYAAVRERTRVERHIPEFPLEVTLTPPLPVPAAAASAAAAAVAKAKKPIQYEPAKVRLDAITDHFTITCHVSPDAGWPQLKDFFARTQQKLSVGIYDFTSAHILNSLEQSLKPNGVKRNLSLVLDHPAPNPTLDQSDEQTEQDLSDDLGESLQFAWAPVRSSPEVHEWMFPSAYHIKAAVRDSSELWLSSGNWNNSNQPEAAPVNDPDAARAAATFKKSDRDWHLLINHPGLAQVYEAFLLNDRETAREAQGADPVMPEIESLSDLTALLADTNPAAAVPRTPRKYFSPITISEQMTIQPLLTPDTLPGASTPQYATQMRELIASAQKSLYIQLQYIHPSDKAEENGFTGLLQALADRIDAGIDVRIILSQWQSGQWMERLQAAGIDTRVVRIQQGVHNKGFVVDHHKVVVSSQNWSSEGVLQNRDAGMIIDNASVAKYFEAIFLHDWDNLAVGRGSVRGVTAGDTESPQIFSWEDDPGTDDPPLVPPELRAVPDLTLAPLQLAIPDRPPPDPRAYDPGTAEFRYWAAADSAERGATFWRGILPQGTNWQPGPTLNLLLDQGQDFNAFYDRQALNFFHGTAAGKTVFSCESPDIVCHEEGHAILDAIRPELFDAGTIEAAAFHESFGDMSAILVALQLATMRTGVLAETSGDLSRNSRLSRLAEQLGWAIRQFSPDSVDPDCLRNASNSFFYTNPEGLPSDAPASSLSSEPHSFSRVFTGAFLEALAGGFRIVSAQQTESDLQAVSVDFARLLIGAALAAPVVPEYMSQLAAAMIAVDAANPGATAGRYADVLKSAFVRRGILSVQSAVGITQANAAGMLAVPHPIAAAVAGGARVLPQIAISAAEYGLGDKPLLIRAASEPRRFSVGAASFGVGPGTPSNSEHAAKAFLEDLMQRGSIDTKSVAVAGITRPIVHPHTLKTHKLTPTANGLELTRILFDCGMH